MPSERRLHPVSILFGLGGQLREFAVPALLLLVTAGSAGLDWQVWLLLLLVPYAFVSVGRYAAFRYRYEAGEIVIRSGLVFRNERHIPYARIQNLDAVQNLLHRLLGVVVVRLETGGGQEPEATMSVLPMAAFVEMRRRVFEQRMPVAVPVDDAKAAAVAVQPVLHLPPPELMLFGLIQNRGVVVIAAAFGLFWELGLMERLSDRLFGEQARGRGIVRDFVTALFGGHDGVAIRHVALTLAAFAGLLLLVRLFSVGWALVRLHGFRLTRAGGDLRAEFGLLTRVAATIPVRRIQTLTVQEGPLHRLFGRVSVRVETAGGTGGGDGATQREWLAPILRRERLHRFVRDVLPDLAVDGIDWQPVHPRAFRRAVKEWGAVAVALALPFVALLKWWDLALVAVLLVWAFVAARASVARLGWACTDGAVLFRSGWLWRQMSVARFTKIQAVVLRESPFDRRAAMARLAVDTAGGGHASHRVTIPYLPRETAHRLHHRLSAEAARTAFRW